MSVRGPPATYRGRSLGIVTLVTLQLLIGIIHLFFGVLLLAYEDFSALPATATYDFYTIAFGALTLVFALFIWQGKKAGLIGTVAVSVFVIIVDSLAILNLPTVPGAPAFPAYVEIPYSLIVIGYLLQPKIKKN